MAKDADEKIVDGALMRGDDGGLYFIPKEDLAAYRIPDDLAGPTLGVLKEVEPAVPGLNFREVQVAPSLKMLPTLFGPIGRRDATAGPADPTASALSLVHFRR